MSSPSEDGEDRTLHNHRCENLKSYIIASILFIQVAVLYTVLVAVTLEVNKRWSWWIMAGCICITGFLIGIICIIPVCKNVLVIAIKWKAEYIFHMFYVVS
jgi:hypothetical protein